MFIPPELQDVLIVDKTSAFPLLKPTATIEQRKIYNEFMKTLQSNGKPIKTKDGVDFTCY